MNTTKRSAIIFVIIFICLVLLAGCVIVAESGHDCIGDNCTICSVIDSAQKILHASTLLTVATAFLGLLKFCFNFILLSNKKRLNSTLILLKVKLSN